jgi:hypothetical protein
MRRQARRPSPMLGADGNILPLKLNEDENPS